MQKRLTGILTSWLTLAQYMIQVVFVTYPLVFDGEAVLRRCERVSRRFPVSVCADPPCRRCWPYAFLCVPCVAVPRRSL